MENEYTSRHNNKKKKNKAVLKLLLLIAILVIAVLVTYFVTKKSISSNDKDNLKGNWSVDDITFYEFDGKGTGKLKVPSEEFEFTYIIHNDEIYLDYKDEKAKDSDYQFSVEGNKLTLKGIKATTGTYTLTKQK